MTRKNKLLLNSSMGMLKQVIALICGFILPRYMLLYFGSDVNGLVSSIAHFLSFISLLEMGIGPVIQANLYKPLADKNDVDISKIIISAEKFYRKIALVFVVYIAVLSFVFPYVISTEYSRFFSITLLLIISISTFAEYYFGVTYQALLNADQKSYVYLSLQIITIILNTLFCVVLMKIGASIHVVKLASSLIFVLRPLGLSLYVRKNYSLNKKLVLSEEPIKQKWNGFAQHSAAVVSGNIDVVLLTFFSTLSNVSIYSVYYTVINGITMLFMTAATGLEAYFGNILANDENENLKTSFERIEMIVHVGVTFLFSITAIVITPFISVYTKGISDANYIMPVFGMILAIAYAVQCLRIPYFRLIKAAGHFKETQNGAFISMGLNIVISAFLVFKFGLVGIAIGTAIAMGYHTFYFVWYLKRNIIKRNMGVFLKYFFADVIVFAVSVLMLKNLTTNCDSYINWILLSFKVTGVVALNIVVVNVIFNFKMIKKIIKK